MANVAADAYAIAFGDFRRGYLIVDRVGIRILRDPYSAKPYVLFYTTGRVGGGVQDLTRSSCCSSATDRNTTTPRMSRCVRSPSIAGLRAASPSLTAGSPRRRRTRTPRLTSLAAVPPGLLPGRAIDGAHPRRAQAVLVSLGQCRLRNAASVRRSLPRGLMATVLLSGPAVEPITLAEAKAQLRVDVSAEDTLIQSLIMASRLHIEAALDLALITQTWRHKRDFWPRSTALNMPTRPIQAVTSVTVFAGDNSGQAIDVDAFVLDGAANPARLVWRGAGAPPIPGRAANGIEIDFVAGFGNAASDVPQTIRQALLLLVAHWYENREPVEIGATATPIPPAVSELLSPYRRRQV